ncbi:MAG: type VI secretion system baseplate subunit TssE [Bdellovibrionota bacterium]
MFSSNSKNEKYPIPVFDKLVNSTKLESKYCDLDTLKYYIRRDLENLLNARKTPILYKSLSEKNRENETEQLEKNNSTQNKEKEIYERSYLNFFHYGLSDYSVRDLSQAQECEDFAQEIKAAIESFEPRLKNIEVMMSANGPNTADRVVHLKIIAHLNIEQVDYDDTEDIYFDTEIFPDKKMIHID